MNRSPSAARPGHIDVFAMARNLPSPRRDFDATYLAAMKHLRRHSVSSLAHLVFGHMRETSANKDKLENIRGVPWQALLLLKWALLDDKVQLEGPELPKKTFDAIRQQLWEVDVYLGRDRTLNVHLMMRSLMHVQIEFQRPQTWGTWRWPVLLLDQPANSPLRKRFREIIGMEPAEFIDLSAALYGGLHSGSGEIGPAHLDPLRHRYGDKVETILGLLSRDLAGLRRELQQDEKQKNRSRTELVETAYLQRFPLVNLRNGGFAWWHPSVFARGLEDAVHQRFSGLGEAYTQAFSRVFEDYVLELVVDSLTPHVPEAEYKGKVSGHARAVEAIMRPGRCNVLVEAKMGLFPEVVLTSDDERAIYEKTKRLRAAIAQVAEVAEALQDHAHTFYDASCATTYALIVTSRELNVATGLALQQLFPNNPITYPSAHSREILPLENVFFLSIRSLERLAGALRSGEVTLGEFLADAVRANASPATAKMFFSDHLTSKVAQFATPRRIETAIKEARQRLGDALVGA